MLHDFARKAVGAKNHEPIRDALRRHEVCALSKIDRSIIYQNDLRLALRSVGINPGDIVMVHCGWRSFYGYMRGGGRSLLWLICCVLWLVIAELC